jgi:hypothetical protein
MQILKILTILTVIVRSVNCCIYSGFITMRFSHLVISLPLLFCASQLTPFSSAFAAPMNAAEATELLAKSHAIDTKCSVLASEQSQDLKDFVARAEISLAEKVSVSKARKTIASGKTAGKAAICDDAAKKLVNDVLAAATAAATAPIEDATTSQPEAKEAALPVSTPVLDKKAEEKVVAIVEPEPAPTVTPVKKAKVAKIVRPLAPAKVANVVKLVKPATPIKGLGKYASVAEQYYVATRCGGMSRGKINALYKSVLSNHQQAVANNRPQAVRAMLQAAEARAGARSCG